ncbi:MAG: hypothetical protein AB7I25_08075 [Vicinamibacterales bacterium]
MPRPRLQPLLIFAAVLAVAVAIHWPALRHTRPFCCDNIAILEWADAARLGDALAGNAEFPLEWRPLPHLLMWTEYRVLGVTPVAPYVLTNLLIWAACVGLVFTLARRLTGSAAGAAVAAGFLVTARQTSSMSEFLMETQMSLACLFGLGAVALALRDRPVGPTTAAAPGATVGPGAGADVSAALAIGALLLAACLGKEYGLAFAAGLMVWALFMHRRAVALAGAVAVAAYLMLRATMTVSGFGCEEHAFFGGYREVCLDRPGAAAVTQVAYNAGVGLIHTVLPGIFADDGLVGIAPLQLLQGACWLVFVALGLRRAPWVTLAVAVLVANAALQAPLFRARNTIPGLVMVALLAGSGFTVLLARLRSRSWPVPARVLPAAVLAALAARGVVTSGNVSRAARHTAIQDPCATLHQPYPVDAGFVRRLKQAYGLPDPDCTQPAAERFLDDEAGSPSGSGRR